jgi:ABC-type amino acid transport substrate-binding protein
MKHFLLLLTMLTVLVPLSVSAADPGTLQRIDESGVIRLGFRESEPPMSFLDEHKKPVGYSIDLCEHIVSEVRAKLGKPDIAVEFVPVTATDRFEAIEKNTIDLLCGATTKTLSRAERVDFTQLTFVTGAALLSKESVNIGGIEALKDQKVAVVEGTTTIDALRNALKDASISAEVVPVPSADAGLRAVLAGEVAAFSSDQVVLIGMVLTFAGEEKFAITNQVFSFEPFALALRRNDSDFRLVADRALSQLNRSGQITPIYQHWFGNFAKEVPNLVRAMYILNSTPE